MKTKRPLIEEIQVDEHEITFRIHDNNGIMGVGLARCCEEDYDVESELAGAHIARYRALINYYKHYIQFELRPRREVLKEMYYSMPQRLRNLPSDRRTKTELAYINVLEDINVAKQIIADLQESLALYFEQREKVIAKYRTKENN